MEIKDLQPRQGNVEVVATIKSIEEPREFEKFGNPGKVANATIEDESGSMKLTLWNDQINQVKVGDKIHITNGYVNEWQGESQLTTGKFGQLEIVGEGESTKTAEKEILIASFLPIFGKIRLQAFSNCSLVILFLI